MSQHRDTLLGRLKKLEEEIAETKKRLPAHSIKPPVMMDLLELEDERDALIKEITRLKGSD
jgi:hypothetical protein